MKTDVPLSLTPKLDALSAALRQIFGSEVPVLRRETPDHTSTFPNEIVTCLTSDGRQLRLLCKYGSGQREITYGHRGGVWYEAEVYKHVLSSVPFTVPRYYGAVEDDTGTTCLVVEFLDNSERVVEAPEPEGIVAAARWIGRFHSWSEQRNRSGEPNLLNVYDHGYLTGWARRTGSFAGHLSSRYPWLGPLCTCFEMLACEILAIPPAIIHGEFYPKNILFRDHLIYPVDWETAAVSAGEIDLASLIEGWAPETSQLCEREYQTARWPIAVPSGFQRRLDLARCYLHLRWLGDRPEWTLHEDSVWHFEQLEAVANRLGVLR